MERWMHKAGPYYRVHVKANFDPAAEICDNQMDDTGNGQVDCDDITCEGTLICRPQSSKSLEVFVMSQCPFGASPTWVANGRHLFHGITPNAIQENYCKKNPDLKGCAKPLPDERVTDVPVGACEGN
ncbi:MAG: hypothetical protein JXR76_26530 [Deltaproteobacteria bacterium]|nr:hypothetical protein [Deltaproteobacteria bacterium]